MSTPPRRRCANTPDTLAPVHDPQSLETNVPGFYVAGSVVSGRNTGRIFIENGRFHGEAIVKSILRSRGVNPRSLS